MRIILYLFFSLSFWKVSAQPQPTASPAVSPAPVASVKAEPIISPSPSAEAKGMVAQKGKVKKMFAIIHYSHDGKPVGKVKIKLYDKLAPKTVENFVGLAEGTIAIKEYDAARPGFFKKVNKRFYDGLIMHRVIPGFMIQGGDPKGTGFGDPGYTIEDEFSKYITHNKPGIVAMANKGTPNSGGCQFYITLTPQERLDNHYSVFGEVVEGMPIVEKIATFPRDPGTDRPSKPVVMTKVEIVREY